MSTDLAKTDAPDHRRSTSPRENLVGVTERRAFLKGGALATLGSFFSFGPFAGKSWAASGPEILEERSIPIPESLLPGVRAMRKAYAKRGFAVPLGKATFKRATIPGGTVSWIEYTGSSIGVTGARALIHAGHHPKFGKYVVGSISSVASNRVVRLESFQVTAGVVQRRTVTKVVGGSAITQAVDGAIVPDLELDAYSKGVDYANDLLAQAETAPLEAFSCCSCVTSINAWYYYVCELVTIVVCGFIATLCFWCGVLCAAVIQTHCYWQLAPCEYNCSSCGCSPSSTECDACCA